MSAFGAGAVALGAGVAAGGGLGLGACASAAENIRPLIAVAERKVFNMFDLR